MPAPTTQPVSAFDLIRDEMSSFDPVDAMKIIGQELYGVADPVIRGMAGEMGSALGRGAVNLPGTIAGAGLAATNTPAGLMRAVMTAGDRVVGAMEDPVGLINALDQAGNTFASSPLHSLNMPMAPVGSLMAAMQAAKGANLPSAGVADQAFAHWQQTPQGADASNLAQLGTNLFDPAMEFYGQQASEMFPQGTDVQANPLTVKGVGSTVAENVPQMAAQMGAAALTGGAAPAGRALAFGLSSLPIETGSAMQEGVQGFQQQGMKRQDAIRAAAPSALGQGAVNAGLEELSGLGLFGAGGDTLAKLAPKLVGEIRQNAAKKIIEQETRGLIDASEAALKRAAVDAMPKRIAKAAGRGVLSEVPTEMAQEFTNVGGEALSGSNPNATDGMLERLTMAGLTAGVLGFGAGGLTGASSRQAPGVFTPTEQDIATARQDGPGARRASKPLDMTTGEGAAGQGGNGQPAGTAEAEALTPQQRDRKRADAVYDSEVETPDHDLAGLLSDAAKAQGVNIRWTDPGEDAAGVMGMQSAREPNTVYVAADALRRRGSFSESMAWETVIDEATHVMDDTSPEVADELRNALGPRVLQQAEQSYVNRYAAASGISTQEARQALGPERLRAEALGTALQMGMADQQIRDRVMGNQGLTSRWANSVREFIGRTTKNGKDRQARIKAFDRFWGSLPRPSTKQQTAPLWMPTKKVANPVPRPASRAETSSNPVTQPAQAQGGIGQQTNQRSGEAPGATPVGNTPAGGRGAPPQRTSRGKAVGMKQRGVAPSTLQGTQTGILPVLKNDISNQAVAEENSGGSGTVQQGGMDAVELDPAVDQRAGQVVDPELEARRKAFHEGVDSSKGPARSRTFALPKTLERKGKPQPGSEFPERPALSKPPAIGRDRPVQLADGRALPAKYAIIEASDLIPTHDPNAGFAPMELGDANERPYEHANEGKASRETVRAIAENPDASMILNNTPTPTDGPPIVSEDFRVLGGNARSMGILTKYGQMPERAEQYRASLKEEASAFGLDPSAIDGFERPILVRQLQIPAGKRGELSRVLNDSMTTAKTVTTEAISRGSKLSLEDADAIAGILGEDTLAETLADPSRSDRVLQVFVRSGALTQQDLVKMRESDGKLTSAAKETIEDALLGSAIGDVAALSAATADIKAKLAKAVPSIIRIKAAGQKIELDISSILADAMEALNGFSGWAAKTNGKSFIDFLRQGSMLPEPWRDNYHAMMLANALRDMTQTAVAKGLKDVASAAMDQVNGEVGLMGEPTGARQVFEQTFGRHDALANILRRQVEKFSIGGWHGTPHEFDRFDTSKIGTGEGAQAYGWGLYFAGKKEVAEWYREKLAGQNQQVYVDGQRKDESADAVDRGAAAWLLDSYTPNITMQSAINRALGAIQVSSATSDGRTSQFIREVVERLNQWKQAETEVRSVKGRLYKVELAPNEEDMLDWDTHLSQQSPKVRDAISKVMSEIEATEPVEVGGGAVPAMPTIDKMTGSQAYRTIERAIIKGKLEPSAATQWIEAKADQHASMKLKEAGIPGIRYLDGSSRQQRAKFEFASTEAQDNARAQFGSEPLSRGKQWADVTLDNNDGNMDKTVAALKDAAARGHGDGGPGIAIKLIESGAIKPAERNSNYVVFDDKDVQIKEKFNIGGTIDVDGKQRPTTNANGKPIAQTAEGLRNFWKWFGDSKVVDGEGRPVPVYHGTSSEFDSFNIAKFGRRDGGWYGRGFYFTPDTEMASAYARDVDPEDEGPINVKPVYLSLQNPYMWPHTRPATYNSKMRQDFQKELASGGYDGVIVRIYDEPIAIHEVVAFEPTQIKSSTGNAGTFDPSNPDIRFNVAPDQPGEIDPRKDPNPAPAKSEIIGTDLFGRPIKTPIRGMQMPLIDTTDYEKLRKEEAEKEWRKRRPDETPAEHKIRLYWDKPENAKKNLELFSVAPPTDSEAFRKWFSNSKVVDAEGKPLVVYHGSQRPDRIANRFRKTRATSGPMAFFTDDPNVAGRYAKDKTDTSLEMPDNYADWFLVKLKGQRSPVNPVQAWNLMSAQQRAEVADKLVRVTNYDEEGNEVGTYRLGKPGTTGVVDRAHWDHVLKREAKGNYIAAAIDIWLSSGNLFDQERQFLEVLRLAGMPGEVSFNDPNAAFPAVLPVYLSIQNPFVVANIDDAFIGAMRKAASRARQQAKPGADQWDKRSQTPQTFISRLEDDAAHNTTHAWTSIPDWVTRELQRMGYDGIKDSGGKNGGIGHAVWIPFTDTQVKSATGNRGTFDGSNPDIRFSVAPDPDKVQRRQQQIEAEAAADNRTLGRPDLANPVDPAAEDGKARRLVDAVDQARTDAGTPEQRADKDVRAQADARLKADWNGEKARLLEVVRAGGQLNDVDTVVATRIVNKAAIDAISFGDAAAYQDAVILASAYRDTGTEQARAFRQRRDQFLTPAERTKAYLAEAIVAPSAKDQAKMQKLQEQLAGTQDEKEQARIAGQLDAMAKQQAADAQLIAQKVRAQGISITSMSDAMLADPSISSQVARAVSTAKASKMDKAQEYWINSILSAPPTHAANIIGNTASVSWETFGQRAIEAAMNAVPGLRTKDGATIGEFAAMMKGLGPAFQDAGRAMVRSFVTERPAFEDKIKGNGVQLGLRSGNEHYKSGAIEGKVGRFVRVPTRALLAEDQFFKAIAGTLETYAAAHRMAKAQGLKGKAAIDFANRQVTDYTSHAWATGLREADRLTFQTELGKVAKLALTAKREVPALAFVIPFVTTPVNIFKAAIAKTPVIGDVPRVARLLAGAGSAIQMKWTGKANGYVYTRREMQRDLANAVVAWGVTMALWSLVGADDDRDEPLITGSRSLNRGESQINARGSNPALSIRIGDKWVSYARIEPFATQLALTVDGIRATKRAKDTGEFQAALGGLGKSLVQSVRDKTFMKGIGDIIDAFDNADNLGQGFGKLGVNFASAWVPNIIRQAQAQARDTVADTTTRLTSDRGTLETLARKTAERAMPALIKSMPRVDVWGRDVDARQIQGLPRTDYIYRILSPVQMVETSKELQVDRLLINWNNQVENDTTGLSKAWYPTPPSNQVEKKGIVVYRMTDAEYADFLREAGQAAHKRIQALIDAKVLSVDKPTQKHIDRIQRIREEEYAKAREKMASSIAGKKAR